MYDDTGSVFISFFLGYFVSYGYGTSDGVGRGFYKVGSSEGELEVFDGRFYPVACGVVSRVWCFSWDGQACFRVLVVWVRGELVEIRAPMSDIGVVEDWDSRTLVRGFNIWVTRKKWANAVINK